VVSGNGKRKRWFNTPESLVFFGVYLPWWPRPQGNLDAIYRTLKDVGARSSLSDLTWLKVQKIKSGFVAWEPSSKDEPNRLLKEPLTGRIKNDGQLVCLLYVFFSRVPRWPIFSGKGRAVV